MSMSASCALQAFPVLRGRGCGLYGRSAWSSLTSAGGVSTASTASGGGSGLDSSAVAGNGTLTASTVASWATLGTVLTRGPPCPAELPARTWWSLTLVVINCVHPDLSLVVGRSLLSLTQLSALVSSGRVVDPLQFCTPLLCTPLDASPALGEPDASIGPCRRTAGSAAALLGELGSLRDAFFDGCGPIRGGRGPVRRGLR